MRTIFSYRTINNLSLDVALGAVISAAFFASLLHVRTGVPSLICLGITVWVIYTIDHLTDVTKLNRKASTLRHRFHQKYFGIIFMALMVCLITAACFLFFLTPYLFINGLWLSAGVTLYFALKSALPWMKEFFAGILYVAGILLVPFTIVGGLTASEFTLVLQFLLTVFTNLLLFAWFDREKDNHDGEHSFVTLFGSRVTSSVLVIFFIFQGMLSVFSYVYFGLHPAANLVIVLMNAGLLMIYIFRKFFQQNERFRLLGDAIFLFPLIYICA